MIDLAYLLHCTISLLAHICYIEPALEEPMEQAQAEYLTNLALDHGKH
jgi:hypothetical protein